MIPHMPELELEAARDALSRLAWQEAFDALSSEDADSLSPKDLEGLGDAAWWTGRHKACIEAREGAYAKWVAAGEPRRAVRVALALCDNYRESKRPSVAASWLKRSMRLLEGEPECVEHGWIAWTMAVHAYAKDRIDESADEAGRALELGMRFGDPDLQALALAYQGAVMIRQGEPDEGLPLLEEATAAAAIDCATQIQRKLAAHRREHGFAPQVRMGIHATEATQDAAGYSGRGVHEAARIGGLAVAGEIVASEGTLDGLDGIAVSPPREAALKGIGEPMRVVSIDWAASG